MRSESYAKVRRRLQKNAREKKFPLRVMFELTYRCNFSCRHCYVPLDYRERGELGTEGVLSIIDQLADIGCLYLGFTGGEPFMRDDILDILWHAKKRGFEVIIYTNGSLIDRARADELVRLRPNKVDITVPAMSEAVFEAISGVRGSRRKVFDAIEVLHKSGVNLGLKTCVLKENEGQLGGIDDLAASLNVSYRLSDVFFPRLNGSMEPFNYRGRIPEVRSPKSEIRGRKSEVRSRKLETECQNIENERRAAPARQRFSGGSDERLFMCGVGVSQAAITPLGELKMCLMIDYPRYKILNFRPQASDLRAAWDRLKELVASIEPDGDYKCDGCDLRSCCDWCPARGWLKDGNFTTREDNCRRLPELKRKDYEERSQA